jgi:hypothetical protein
VVLELSKDKKIGFCSMLSEEWQISQYNNMKVTITAETIPSNNREIEYVITDGSPPNKNVLTMLHRRLTPLGIAINN